MRRTSVVVVLVGLVAVVAAGLWLLTRPDGRDEPASSPRTRAAAPTASPSASPPPSATPPRSRCARPSRKPFQPTSIRVPGVPGGRVVLALSRDANDIPGVPPQTSAGKASFAWDRDQGVSPGDEHGNVLLNAHTWPDGSALGNQLLEALDKGDRIEVRGGPRVLCYKVTEEVVVSAAEGLPRYYATKGPPRLAIVVCSGRRFGPGQWEDRTIWFATPQRPARS